MASIDELSNALINADKAGDVDAARALAAEIQRMRAQQPLSAESRALAADLSSMTQNPGEAIASQRAETNRAQYEQLPEWKKAIVAAGDTADLLANGVTFGFGNKAAAAGRALFTDKTYDQELLKMRERTQDSRDRAGSAGVASEVVGSVAAPVAAAGKGLTIAGRLGTAGMKGATGLAARSGLMGLEGAGYGSLTALGNDQDVSTGAGLGFVGGAAGNVIGEGISAGVSKIAGLFNKKPSVPNIDDLAALKDAAYKRADNAGVVYTPKAVAKVNTNIVNDLTDMGYDPALMPGAAVAVKRLQDLEGQNVTLTGLDTIRKIASNGFIPGNKANNAAVSKIVNSIDDMIDNAGADDILVGNGAGAAGALKEARSLASRVAKHSKVEQAVNRADLQASSTGSGGNVDNATRQKLRKILENPRGFSVDERAALETAVRGTTGQNALRLAGKLSPSGNGLMAALGVGGAMVNPAVGAASLGGMGAKAIADALTRKNVGTLQNIILAGGDASATKAAPNLVQRLSESKREAIARALMAIGAREAGTP
ncbi:hypothetical protein [Rhizobium lentis]|uniref:Uncharacterized protein n=1 Tax=Rhizobium lentis TaxID=1138194 RepID=A0ABS7ID31_9HYPH|nr:hypothetical protein [Rhizobium lentis]MBX5089344.1 hypothetical protein [Rhizobium lentis]